MFRKRPLLALIWMLAVMASPSLFAAQFAYPQTEEATPTNNYTPVGAATNVQAVDEGATPNDADYTSTNTSADTIEFNLTNTLTDPNDTSGHIIRARGQSNKSNTTVELQLYQGGSQIATSGPLVVDKNAWLTVSYTLTTGEAGSITNYDDLRVRLVAQGAVSAQRDLWISWIEMEIPDAAAVVAPTVTSPTFADVTDTTATLGGTVTSDGGEALIARGVEWGTSPGTYPNSVTEGGTAVSLFTTGVSSLPSGTLIYFRAWAENTTAGKGYSSESSFTTHATVSAPTFSAVTDTTATLGGTVSSTGAATVTDRGTVWGTSPNPTGNALSEGTGNGTFTHGRTGLPSGTLIYFRAYATNAGGTSYSADSTFTTLPTVSAPTVSAVTDTTATLGGTVSSTGAATVTDRGTVWGTSPNPTGNSLSEGSGNGTFTHGRTGLPSGTLIYFRAYATNAGGTSYSADSTFTTHATVSAPTFSAVTDTTATLGGTVASDGAAAVTDRGTVWGTSPNPTGNALSEGTGNGTFTHGRTGLPANTLIYFRAYATNAGGTSYSPDGSFTTDAGAPTVTTPTFADVTDTTATLGGTVTSDGGAALTSRGVEWGTSPGGPYPNSVTEGGTAVSLFTTGVTGLPSGTLIYFRAWADNGIKGYSSESSFTTLATVSAPTFADVTDTTATLGGTVSSTGAATVTDRGTVWGTSPNPTGNALSEGTGNGIFTHGRTGLPSGTLIYFRAYATNAGGTSYSADSTFTTLPTVSAPTFSAVTDTTATLGGTVASDGAATVTDRGTVWGTSPNPTGNALSEGTGNGIFTHGRTGLPSGTLIYFRAYATNAGGTSYSADSTFTTLPTVSAPTFSAVTDTTATLGGTVASDGAATVTDRGTVWDTSPNPTGNSLSEGSGNGTFTHGRTGLPAGTLIYFRAYATNAGGTAYSPDGSFTTDAGAPAVTTPTFADVTDTTATLGGTVISDGGEALIARGVEWGTSPGGPYPNSVTEGGTAVSLFTTGVTGLPSGTLIYFRAWAENTSAGKGYSSESSFTTHATVSAPTFADVTDTTATLGGTVSSTGAATVTDRGTVWGTSPNPTGNALSEGSGNGTFTHARTGLPSGTLIYFRAYATNAGGTSYSADSTFTTLPTVSAPTFTAESETSATLGGTVASDGAAAVTDRGTVWGTSPNPTGNSLSEGTGNGTFTHLRTGLPTETLVYYRAYATNAGGTSYSADGTFTLSVATTPPLIDTPTATNITYYSADLGGTITSDGGKPITERGTLWNLTGAPIIENKSVEGGTTTGAFSHTRIGMPNGVTVWYRAYATNENGTTYTADASFVTDAEPSVQVSNITFPQVGANSMRINWTRGNGVGSIVVLRLAATGRTDPADGVPYTGNADFALAPELPTNSENFVIYSGTHNAIQVHGLSQLTNYTVAVYTYAGSGAGINYLTPPAEASQATTDVPVHNMDYAPDCSHCHNHGQFLARGTEQEAVCVTCHFDTGPATNKLDFALHLTPGYASKDDVDCGSCHELHNPGGDTTSTHTLTPFATDINKSFIRSNVDKYVPTAAAGNVAIYHTPSDDLAIEGGDATTARGICQSCHTEVGNHRHDGTGEQCHDGGANDSCGPAQVDCSGCHTHTGNFAPSGGGGCSGCHSSAKGTPPNDRREIISEFARLSTHIDSGSLTDTDCEVCHAQAPTDNSHIHNGPGDKRVTLWDTDDHATSYQLGVYSDPTASHTEATLLNPVCLSCHDSDGAAAEDNTGGGDENTPLSPFTGSITPKNIASTWSGSSHATVTPSYLSNPVSCFGDGAFGCHGSGHGGEKLTLLAPADTAATGPDFSEQREGFCLNCHDGDGSSDIDIATLLGTAGGGYQDNGNNGSGAPINQKHDILPADQTYSGGAVTCRDCHDPHIANNTNPNVDPDTDLQYTSTYSTGNSYTDDGYNWTYDSGSNLDPTNPLGASGGPYTEPDTVEFCLTCHDGTTPAGVTMSSGMLNIALTYQTDYHGRGDAGSAGNGDFKPPWVVTLGQEPGTPYAAMNCTICHDAHGSGNIYHLRESITVAGSTQQVGGWSGDTIGALSGTTYTLPLTGGVQVDHDWGGWCSFCHNMQPHKVDEDKACRSGHMHGGGAF